MLPKEWKHRRQQKSFSRDERKAQIMGMFAIWQNNEDTEPKTMYRIARSLGMSPDQNITDMLLELVADGKLAFVEREKSGRWTARGYYPIVSTLITEKSLRRRITVQKRGVAVGQLEMFS